MRYLCVILSLAIWKGVLYLDKIKNKSNLSKRLETTKRIEQFDACAKKLLSEKIILAWILKSCVEEFKDCSIQWIMTEGIVDDIEVSTQAVDMDEEDITEAELSGSNTENNSIKEGKIFYDIRFDAKAPNADDYIHLIINLEAQKGEKLSYPLLKRAVYYVSRMISSQKNTVFYKTNYKNIRKVYSIWVIMNSNKENTITKYSMHEQSIVGNVHANVSDYDLMSIYMIRLGRTIDETNESILRLLGTIFKSRNNRDQERILEEEYNIPMIISRKGEVNDMSSLGEGIYEEGVEEGIEKGIERSIKTLLVKGKSVEEVADLLDVDIDKVKAIEEQMLVDV